MKYQTLGDWCKWLEKNFSNEVLIPTLPVIIRLDGNNFSKWTKGLDTPFDLRFVKLMVETTKYLVEETNAVVGYTQSDEITLILYSDDRSKQIYNGGKKQKMVSKLTAKCVNFFNEKRLKFLPNHNKMAVFDCRVYQVPTLHDACVQLLWRENDATRNSILMLGYNLFSHKQLHGLKTNEIQDKLMLEKGVNWNHMRSSLKRGTYIKRFKEKRKFTEEELKKLPSNHNALKNPDLDFERSIIKEVEYPIFNKIKNKEDVIFNDCEPILN